MAAPEQSSAPYPREKNLNFSSEKFIKFLIFLILKLEGFNCLQENWKRYSELREPNLGPSDV